MKRFLFAFILIILTASIAFADATEDLFNAVKNGNITVKQINSLKKRGANFRAFDENNLTALMWAVARQRDTKIISAMIKAGSDVNAHGDDGNTPLMNAAFLRAVRLYGYYGSSSVKVQMKPDVARVLIKAGAKVNARNDHGATPLHSAIHAANPGVIKILLNAGADVNARDNGGYTALMYAASENNLDTVRALLDAGANPNVQEKKYGLTALMRASFTDDGNPEMAGLLVRYGADIYLEDWSGKNVLEYDLLDEVRAAIVNSVR